MPTTSSNNQPSLMKRKLSTESTNIDNDYDDDFSGNKNEKSKQMNQFCADLTQDNSFDKKEDNIMLNLSFSNSINDNKSNNNNNNNDLAVNEDGNYKDRSEMSSKAKEKLQLEREKQIRKKRLEQQEEENKKMQ